MLEEHKTLTVYGSEAGLDDFVERLTDRTGEGWRRHREGERRIGGDNPASDGGIWYAFEWAGDAGRPAASLWLRRLDGAIEVGNIVPRDRRSLTRREYNAILDDFAERFVSPAAERAGVGCDISSGLLDVQTLTDAATYEALCRFSRAANREAALVDPLDEGRWNAFVIAAHKTESALGGHILERWLIEEEGWPPTAAQELAEQYEHDRALLRDFASAAA